MKTRKFLVSFTCKVGCNMANGRSFIVENSKVTQKLIEKWEKEIKKDGNYENVLITSFQELED